jgi:hypothetical protein
MLHCSPGTSPFCMGPGFSSAALRKPDVSDLLNSIDLPELGNARVPACCAAPGTRGQDRGFGADFAAFLPAYSGKFSRNLSVQCSKQRGIEVPARRVKHGWAVFGVLRWFQ